MGKIKAGVAVGLLVLAIYSCHLYVSAPERAARGLLLASRFRPGGPTLRVKLTVPHRSILTAPDGVAICYEGGKTEQLPPQMAPLLFEQGRIAWGEKSFLQTVRVESRGRLLQINENPYCGALSLIPSEGIVVNEVSCEEYLLGVVGNECRSDFKPAALRAQAIASRTYALYQYLFRSKNLYHLTDTTASQVYRGQGKVPGSIRKAVGETFGLVLCYEGRVFQAYYHSTCGGNTTRASRYFSESDIPPLRGTICRWCRRSPFYRWEAQYLEEAVRGALSADPAVRKALGAVGAQLGPLVAIEPLRQAGDRYPAYVRITHEGGSFELFALRFRSLLNGLTRDQRLRSPAVEAWRRASDGRVIRLRGSGCGHGVGLCQWGAEGQAEAGRDYLTILLHYYPGATLLRAWSPQSPDNIASR